MVMFGWSELLKTVRLYTAHCFRMFGCPLINVAESWVTRANGDAGLAWHGRMYIKEFP
jgi:hypothetical protein